MKKVSIVILTLFALSCEPPLVFTEEVSQEKAIAINGNEVTLDEVFESVKGNVVLIDVWATWCRDCIIGFPKLKELQEQYPNIEYLFLSVDRTDRAWKNGIRKYNLKGQHYFLPNGQKGALGDFLNSNWIPRYLILDKDGNIALFKAKSAKDKNIKLTLDKLTN